MEEKKTVPFRKTVFESVPTFIPLSLAVLALAGAAALALQPCADK